MISLAFSFPLNPYRYFPDEYFLPGINIPNAEKLNTQSAVKELGKRERKTCSKPSKFYYFLICNLLENILKTVRFDIKLTAIVSEYRFAFARTTNFHTKNTIISRIQKKVAIKQTSRAGLTLLR